VTENTTPKRPVPPPLAFVPPNCSICGEETRVEDGYYCDNCEATWDYDGAPDGAWIELDAEQCPSIHKPYPNDTNERLAAIEYRCLLEADHANRGVDTHQHPQSWDGWKDPEPSVADASA
jgi:hypothetical protein